MYVSGVATTVSRSHQNCQEQAQENEEAHVGRGPRLALEIIAAFRFRPVVDLLHLADLAGSYFLTGADFRPHFVRQLQNEQRISTTTIRKGLKC
jgi:hypothetical protein